MTLTRTCLIYITVFATIGHTLSAASFDEDVHPYFQTYCLECHNAEEREGGMDLSVIRRSADFLDHPTALTHVIDVLDFRDMPPANAEMQPTEEETVAVLTWLESELQRQRNAAPNDPGIVASPRLNSSEYGNVIRDLFETEAFDASAFLPPEGGAGEGFTNVGNAQSFGTTQFESYLTAANRVLSYARITPETGITWSQIPIGELPTEKALTDELIQSWENWMGLQMNAFADRHKQEVRKQTNMFWGAYLERAWMYHYRQALRKPWSSIEQAATSMEPQLLPENLATYVGFVSNDPSLGIGELKEILKNPVAQDLLKRVVSFQERNPDKIRSFFQETESWFEEYASDNRWGDYNKRGKLLSFDAVPGANYRDYNRSWEGGVAHMPVDLNLSETGNVILSTLEMADGNENDYMIWTDGLFYFEDGSTRPWEEVLPGGLMKQDGTRVRWGSDATGAALNSNQIGVQAPSHLGFKIPDGAKALYVIGRVHPDYKDAGSYQPTVNDRIPETVQGRLVGGRVLNAASSNAARNINRPFGQASGFFERFGRGLRTGERDMFHGVPWFNEEIAQKLNVPWPQTNIPGSGSFRLMPMTIYSYAPEQEKEKLKSIAQQIQEVVREPNPQQELDSMKSLVGSIAQRAWRRPPTPEEMDELVTLYQTDRDMGLTYDFAVKTALKAVLVSPDFIFRAQRSRNSSEPYPIAPLDLADRLSFFIWASLPDNELLQAAVSGNLSTPNDLRREARRMLRDPRASAMAKDFAAQWFQVQDFHNFSGPDAEKFKQFDPDLASDMYQETVMFFDDMIRNNRSILNLIDTDYAFLNERLAKHYGIPGVKGETLRKVELPSDSPRGGLITQGSVLTKTSAPLRTSQVKRGVWVYEQVLGKHIPPPPPVPTLSDDETNEEGLTVAQQLAEHRSRPECFSCHAKFDALGFALENFDPIGSWRTQVAGRPVENAEQLGTGQVVDGLEGLRSLLYNRKREVAEAFAKKLTGYAIGRGLLITDQPLIEAMVRALETNDYKPIAAMDILLGSPQFLTRRDETTELSQMD